MVFELSAQGLVFFLCPWCLTHLQAHSKQWMFVKLVIEQIKFLVCSLFYLKIIVPTTDRYRFLKVFRSLNQNVGFPSYQALPCVRTNTGLCTNLHFFNLLLPNSLETFFLVHFHLNDNFQLCKGKPFLRHLICISLQDVVYKNAKL